MHHTIYGPLSSDICLIQAVGEHEVGTLDKEIEYIRAGVGGTEFSLAAVLVDDWNMDLSPWEAAPVFGNEAFGGDGERTLRYITEVVIPESRAAYSVGSDNADGEFSRSGRH